MEEFILASDLVRYLQVLRYSPLFDRLRAWNFETKGFHGVALVCSLAMFQISLLSLSSHLMLTSGISSVHISSIFPLDFLIRVQVISRLFLYFVDNDPVIQQFESAKHISTLVYIPHPLPCKLFSRTYVIGTYTAVHRWYMKVTETVMRSSITPDGVYCRVSSPASVGVMVDGVKLVASARVIAATW